MKHIITIHTILCGLLSSAIIASEGNINSPKTIVIHGDLVTMKTYDLSAPIHEATISRSCDNLHTSSPREIEPTRPKRTFSKNRQFISSSQSSSSGSSISLPLLSFRSIDEDMPTIDDCMGVNNFFVESNGKYCLINDNGQIDHNRHMNDATSFLQQYKTRLIKKDNTFFIQIISLIGSARSFSPEKADNNVKTQVTNAQIKKLQEFIQNQTLFAHDKWQKNLYSINSIDLPTDNGNSTT